MWNWCPICILCSVLHLTSTKILVRGIVISVTNMENMFLNAEKFNNNKAIGCWNVGSVTNIGSLFYEACAPLNILL